MCECESRSMQQLQEGRSTERIPVTAVIIEPPRWKTNNVVSEQVRHKLSCIVTEDGYVEAGDFGFRK